MGITVQCDSCGCALEANSYAALDALMSDGMVDYDGVVACAPCSEAMRKMKREADAIGKLAAAEALQKMLAERKR